MAVARAEGAGLQNSTSHASADRQDTLRHLRNLWAAELEAHARRMNDIQTLAKHLGFVISDIKSVRQDIGTHS
jgi:ribosomal protein L20